MPINIEAENQFHQTLSASKMVLADFYADWCEPCKWLAIILESMELDLPVGTKIVKIDVEKHTELGSIYGIKSVPVLILFKNGIEVWRMNGFLLKDELLEKITEFSRGT